MTEPAQQRPLRAPVSARPSPRVAASAEHHSRLVGHLTTRDRWLTRLCAEHRVLTSHQITRVAFPSQRSANHRLPELVRWRVLDRFEPYVPRGRAAMCYVLDTAGAVLLAEEDSLDPTALKFRPERSIGIAHSLRLAHLLGVNDVLTRAIHYAREHPETGLTAWWSETHCARQFGDHVRPDSYARWHEYGREIEWFLEYDTGSSGLARLVSKLPGYANLAATTGITTPLLIVHATPGREPHARRRLAEHLRTHTGGDSVPVATTTRELLHTAGHPAAPIWLPLHTDQPGRRRLIDLLDDWPHLPTHITPAELDTPSAGAQPTAAPSARAGRDRWLPPAPMPPWEPGTTPWSPQ